MLVRAADCPKAASYSVEEGQFVIRLEMMDGSVKVVDRCSHVSIALSESTGMIVKHGPQAAVASWARGKKGLSIATVAVGFSLEKLNRAVSNWYEAKKIIAEVMEEERLLPAGGSMVQASDIKWGSYGGFEGPFWPGKMKFTLPANPDFLDKALFTVTATEGGAYDAVNMYDRCILSVGLIQFCESVFNFSSILARCAEMDQFMLDNALKQMPTPTSFKKNKQGIWRFYDGEIEVSTPERQRSLFLGSEAAGKKGSWAQLGAEVKAHAKQVAACMANIWEVPLFKIVQAESTKKKLMGFVLPEAKALLFSSTRAEDEFHWAGALRAMYLSFAANNPTIANRAIQKAASTVYWGEEFDYDRFVISAQCMTFGPQIEIYPDRYGAIAPVLQKVFGLGPEIPWTPDDLDRWDEKWPEEVRVETSDEEKQVAARQLKLSTDLAHGRGEGLDALDDLMKEHPNDEGEPGGAA